MHKINPWWLWLACLVLMFVGAFAFAETTVRPVISCGSLIGAGEVRFAFPDKTFVIKINCPESTV